MWERTFDSDEHGTEIHDEELQSVRVNNGAQAPSDGQDCSHAHKDDHGHVQVVPTESLLNKDGAGVHIYLENKSAVARS